jgi:hypothetical protein
MSMPNDVVAQALEEVAKAVSNAMARAQRGPGQLDMDPVDFCDKLIGQALLQAKALRTQSPQPPPFQFITGKDGDDPIRTEADGRRDVHPPRQSDGVELFRAVPEFVGGRGQWSHTYERIPEAEAVIEATLAWRATKVASDILDPAEANLWNALVILNSRLSRKEDSRG